MRIKRGEERRKIGKEGEENKYWKRKRGRERRRMGEDKARRRKN